MEKISVTKRDGIGTQEFNASKIEKAILRAMKNGSGIVSPKVASNVASEIQEVAAERGEISVPEIETMVYEKLIAKGHKLTARAYEGYRSIREFQRKSNTIDSELSELLQGDSEYWKSENSNKDSKLVTVQRDYMAGIVSIDAARRRIFPPELIQAHDEGMIHIHDMDYIGQRELFNCELANIGDMLQNGTVINGVKIHKPHRLWKAATIATQAITGISSSQFGGTSVSLTHLAPFVRDSYNSFLEKYRSEGLTDDLCVRLAKRDLKKEINDSMQTLVYQLNSMTNTNGQSPFITIFMYLGETEEYKEELAMLIEEILNQRIEGMPNEQGVMVTPAFPKLIYALEPDNLRGGKYYYLTELAAKCSIKRLVPDYISEKKMKELKEGNCYPAMGCRSFLSPWKDENGEYKFYGRFNQGVVTLSLPDVGLSAGGDLDKFWEILEERLELCHQALRIKHKRLLGVKSDAAPILWQHGSIARLGKGEVIDPYLFGGYSTISLGYAGLYECVMALTGKSHTEETELALKIMQKLNDACNRWKEEENIGYSVYGTPIESTTYKFAKCLKKRFGEVPGVSDRDYITNSYHVNVSECINPLDKIKFESKFQELSPGGMISYIECSDLQDNPEAVMQVIEFIYDNIAYAELNIKSDYCQNCGSTKEIPIVEDESGKLIWRCSECGTTDDSGLLHVARRTCGYIGSNFFNQGRTAEIKNRFVHLDDHKLDL